MSAPGTQWFRALERLEPTVQPVCDGEILDVRCTQPAAWGVSLGSSVGLACDGCKTAIDQARFGKPAGLRWVRI